ncbi:uncharacterized protein LOC109117362 [Fukomys damarensis]|uniref:uncharacterized protein LOC109117362 n=1 Tax=Fukomys damarensis TaxID=885580 RepID=UPI001455CA57|nr:uncharacterized protein LOC109117362 [Fukomys damarensis]
MKTKENSPRERHIKRNRNISGRRCDLLQRKGRQKTLRYYYKKHSDAINITLYKRDIFRTNCYFCVNQNASKFTENPHDEDKLTSLLQHFLFHIEERPEPNPMNCYLHMISSLISCFLCKGCYYSYTLCKELIKNNPEEAQQFLIETADWYYKNPDISNYILGSIESWFTRIMLKPILQDLLFEYNAYTTWYEFYKHYCCQ